MSRNIDNTIKEKLDIAPKLCLYKSLSLPNKDWYIACREDILLKDSLRDC